VPASCTNCYERHIKHCRRNLLANRSYAGDMDTNNMQPSLRRRVEQANLASAYFGRAAVRADDLLGFAQDMHLGWVWNWLYLEASPSAWDLVMRTMTSWREMLRAMNVLPIRSRLPPLSPP
jgi:hypothetical protein